MSIDSVWRLEDYRVKDGVLIPHRLVRENGGRINMFLWDEMEHNRPVDPAVFALPAVEDVFHEVFEGLAPSPVLPMLQMKELSYSHSDMNIPCRDGRFLYDIIVENKFRRGLEIGTFTGYSTLWMGLAFQQTGGEITTLEIDPDCAKEAQANFLKAGLKDVIHSRVGDALAEIPLLKGKYDFVFIDANKPDYLKYFRLIEPLMMEGGMIVAHNVTNYARDMKDFIEAVQNTPGLETSFYPISEEGFSVTTVRKRKTH